MKCTFIEEHRDQWPVRLLCDVLGISTAAYYVARERPVSARQQRRDNLHQKIVTIHQQVKARYGSPRIHAELLEQGESCCVNTVAAVMKEHGIAAKTKKKYRCTTDSNHPYPIAANVLDRQFDPVAINRVWCTDITYLPTRDGWLYLAVVEDLFSRRIVGWSMNATMESRLVVDALEMAIQQRVPDAELLAHSDRGRQYASEHYQRVLNRNGITCSMSRRANCWDNAPVESFFATLKKELVHDEDYHTREQARRSIFEYIEVFYNRQRRHSALGYVSPNDYEQSL